jgi:lipopolysaccharide export system protein LptA
MLALQAPQPAFAQTVDTANLSAASKEKKEVNIEADQMEVMDKERKAIFMGNVDATRGDVRLKSDKLVVTYNEVQQTDGSKKTDVTFLDASGNVVIVTARQRITGQTAHMDVKANKVTVDGNVTVTQGETILRGRPLLVDLDTNTSQLTGGRVKGSFVPQ